MKTSRPLIFALFDSRITPGLRGGATMLALVLVACGGKSASQTESPPAAAPVPSMAPVPAPNAMPKAPAPGAAAVAPSGPASAGGLTWSDAAPLVRHKPKSSMRAAEYGVADDDRAELTVFYFGADQGGSVESNVARWLGQLTQADGTDSAEKAKRSKREVGGIPVTLVEVTGNYSGGMAMPGAPPAVPQPDAMLLGAIADGPKGPVFFKLVGARETVEHSRAAFDQMIASLHAGG